MFTKEQNETLTRVGPGTAMGDVLRRFWMPALLEEELPEADCPPKKLRLLGEELVAFRDSDGRVGILDAYCPHRRAHLYYGRNEDCGIRCAYHGWKFDVEGNCVDMPSEPESSTYKDKIKTTAYPTHIAGGAIWVYMGPPEEQPPFPIFEWTEAPEGRFTVTKRWQHCNWAQAVEGGIDSAHISFVHRRLKDLKPGNAPETLHVKYARAGNPKFKVSTTDYGLLIAAERAGPEGDDFNYWRVTQFLLPNFSMIPTPLQQDPDSRALPYNGHVWVPIDDENTWTWSFGVSPHRDYTPAEAENFGGRNGMWGPVDEDFMPLLNKFNDYELSREMQKTENFTGIVGIPNQDAAVQESMGAISDRPGEHLGQTDKAIIMFRQKLLSMASALARSEQFEVLRHPEAYRVRPASLLVAKGADFMDAAEPLIRPAAHEQEARHDAENHVH